MTIEVSRSFYPICVLMIQASVGYIKRLAVPESYASYLASRCLKALRLPMQAETQTACVPTVSNPAIQQAQQAWGQPCKRETGPV